MYIIVTAILQSELNTHTPQPHQQHSTQQSTVKFAALSDLHWQHAVSLESCKRHIPAGCCIPGCAGRQMSLPVMKTALKRPSLSSRSRSLSCSSDGNTSKAGCSRSLTQSSGSAPLSCRPAHGPHPVSQGLVAAPLHLWRYIVKGSSNLANTHALDAQLQVEIPMNEQRPAVVQNSIRMCVSEDWALPAQ